MRSDNTPEYEYILKELDNKLASYKREFHKIKLTIIRSYLAREDCDIVDIFDDSNRDKYTKNMGQHITKYAFTKEISNHKHANNKEIQLRIEYDISPIVDKYENYDYTNLFDRLNKKYNLIEYYNPKSYYFMRFIIMILMILFTLISMYVFNDIFLDISSTELTYENASYLITTIILYILGIDAIRYSYHSHIYYANKVDKVDKIKKYSRILEPQLTTYAIYTL